MEEASVQPASKNRFLKVGQIPAVSRNQKMLICRNRQEITNEIGATY